jgi:hypothetical protein
MKHRLVKTRPTKWRRLLWTAGAAGLVAAASVGPITHQGAGADIVVAYSSTKNLTRTFVNPDSSTTDVDSRDVTVSVSATTDLHNLQPVTVSWTGAHPTGDVAGNPNDAGALNQEYPVAIFECRGTDAAGSLSPKTCWTHGSSSRFQGWNGSAYAPWMLDRYAPDSDKAPFVNKPNLTPPAGVSTCDASNEFEHWLPFVAADGKTYSYSPNPCVDLPPEDYNVESSAITIPSNATFAGSDLSGAGSTKFDMWTDEQNASLGCSAEVACSLVVIPIMGLSCDLTAVASADQAQAATDCESKGSYAPGSGQGSIPGDTAVNGALWWSASNWNQRFSIPLNFAPVDRTCTNGGGSALPMYGSELMIEATNQWAPKFCEDPSLFKFTHVQTGEPLARSALSQGSSYAALGSYSPTGGFTTPTVQAPVAISGFAISYTIDDAGGHPYTNLRLTPRLLAKLMTESYADSFAVKSGDLALSSRNPINILADPEFQAINPGLKTSAILDSAATLLQLSGNADATYALTSYLLADPEAKDWLSGTPDPWGMTINPAYLGLTLPAFSWPLLDTYVPPPNADGCPSDVPWLPIVASPVSSLVQAEQAVQFATSTSKTACSNPGAPAIPQRVAQGRQNPGFRFVIGLTSLSGAKQYGVDIAALQSSSSIADTGAQFSDASGRTFVPPSSASLGAGAKSLTLDSASETFPVSSAALRSVPDAYPGLMVVYADVPTSGLPASDAIDLSKFLLYAAGPGQKVGVGFGDLPAGGYYPMTAANGLAAMVNATVADAATVAAQTQLTAAAASAVTQDLPTYQAQNAPVSPITNTGLAGTTSPSTVSSGPARAKGATPGMIPAARSSLAGAALPVLLGAALLGGLGGAVIRFWSSRPRLRPGVGFIGKLRRSA